jgi:hypothetical protein
MLEQRSQSQKCFTWERWPTSLQRTHFDSSRPDQSGSERTSRRQSSEIQPGTQDSHTLDEHSEIVRLSSSHSLPESQACPSAPRKTLRPSSNWVLRGLPLLFNEFDSSDFSERKKWAQFCVTPGSKFGASDRNGARTSENCRWHRGACFRHSFRGNRFALALAVGLGSKELVTKSLERDAKRTPADTVEEPLRHL